MTVLLRPLAGIALATTILAACGGEGGGGGGGGPSAPTGATTATVTPGQEKTPQILQVGRYKVAWETKGCSSVEITLATPDGNVFYSKKSRLPRFSTLRNIPDGGVLVAQVDPSCADWTIKLDRVGPPGQGDSSD
ncbi:MAG TPA: hypothetical protein VFK38_04645 [Candidatus Limnocylindrales bacterium]|nr:hypothetical protein [Candidatus Limnocylindrales bacterium]